MDTTEGTTEGTTELSPCVKFSKFTTSKSVVIDGESKVLLGKEFNLVDDEIKKYSNGVLIAGKVETITTPLDLLEVEKVINSLTETQALGWGSNQTDCNTVFSSSHQAHIERVSSIRNSI